MINANGKVEARHNAILQMLNSNDSVSVAELCEKTGCSESTIRNDLVLLERRGELLRTFGGAKKTAATPYNLQEWNARRTAYQAEKRAIARYVVRNILVPNSVVIIDAGTTGFELAKAIAESEVPLTVLTNSAQAAMALLPKSEDINLFLFGGMYNPVRAAFYDGHLEHVLREMRANTYFMTANGISADFGLTISGMEEARIKRQMMEVSAETVVLADHSKIGCNLLKRVADCSEVSGIVTDEGAGEQALKQLGQCNVRTWIAPLI
ncbi:MAG: DeoR/GlpR transcriptional regulator [Clostridiales bacterium]|nr:DeoR/GlpR transcriptional regulator [Clostridiales bacterium]